MIELLLGIVLVLQVNLYQVVHDSNDIQYIKLTDKGVYAEAYNKDKELVDTYKILDTKE